MDSGGISNNSNNKANNIVLFSRSNEGEDQEDVWDDRALIRAYDRSVRKIKKEISNRLESNKQEKKLETKVAEEEYDDEDEDEDDDEEEEDQDEYDEENEGYYDQDQENDETIEVKSLDLKKRKDDEWKEEDLCMAVYTDDGLLYPANIIKILDTQDQRKKCIVKYLFYFNEEEKFLDELYEYVDNKNSKKENEIPKVKEIESTKKDTKIKSSKKEPVDKEDLAKLPSGFNLPPPPLPFQMNAGNENVSDEDALHSMLLSWYMSGYHTGYYYGLMQSKKSNKSPSKDSKSK